MLEATPAVEVIEKFNAAFNNRDLEAYIALVDDDAIWEDDIFPGSRGAEGVRERYRHLFERDTEQHLTLLGRMIYGPYVIDQYNVLGRPESPFTVQFCYRVDKGKITYAWLMRESDEIPKVKNPVQK